MSFSSSSSWVYEALWLALLQPRAPWRFPSDPDGPSRQHGADGSVVCYSYDAARNMIQCHGNGFTNRYEYDYLRRLNRQVHEGTDGITSNSFVYDGLDMIVKLDEMSGEIVCFTRGLGIAPGVGDVVGETHIVAGSTQTFLYVQNHRGDTVALVDESGDVVGTYGYDAWGNIVSHSGQDAYFTFSSKHYDENAGLYYYGFRWYDPVSKRWTQPDPEGLSEGLDLYQFCGNDPINSVDVYGAWICAADIGHAWLGLLEQAKNLATVSTGVAWFDNAVNTLNYSYIDLVGGKIVAGSLFLGDNAYDRYLYDVCELARSPWNATADAFALTFFDLFGITSIAEGAFGVDRVTGLPLGWADRTTRISGGVAGLTLWAAGIKAGIDAGEIGYLPPARTGRLWNPTISESDVGHIFRADHNIVDSVAFRSLIESTALNIKNYLGVDKHGTHLFAKVLPNGSQIWCGMRNGGIRYGGINRVARTYYPGVGLR